MNAALRNSYLGAGVALVLSALSNTGLAAESSAVAPSQQAPRAPMAPRAPNAPAYNTTNPQREVAPEQPAQPAPTMEQQRKQIGADIEQERKND